MSLMCAPASAKVLEEIVVTATKREEGIQDVPISIAVVPGESLQRDVVRDLFQLAPQIPNLSISRALVSDNIHIRGVGSGNERSFEQAVGMFIDNVYMPRSRQYRAPFLDVDRVEVARGPQSVLFGLNATAGAIATHTARSRPGDSFVADVTAEYEIEYGGQALTAVIGGSPSDRVGLRLAARVQDSGDGYWKNSATGRDENTLEETVLRGSAVVELSDAIAIDGKLEYSRFERDGNIDELFTEVGAISDGSDKLDWTRGQDSSLLPLFPSPRQSGFSGELFNATASLEAELNNGGKFTGTFGYSEFEWELYLDLDSTPVQIIDAGVIEDYEQTSLELRYSSSDARNVRWIVGGYLAANSMQQSQPNLVDGDVLLSPLGFPVAGFDAGRLWSNAEFDQDEDVESAYGMVTWDVGDAVQFRGGVRYVRSKKDHIRAGECLVRRSDGSFDDLDVAGNPNDQLLTLIGFCPTIPDPADRSRTSSNVLPEVSVQWSASESTMLYVKAGKSAKSGGFVASTIVAPGFFEYDDETGTGYEAGLKSSFAGGRGEISLAAFLADYEDLQLNTFDPNTAASIVSNAGEVRSEGIEIEVRFAASDALIVGASLGFLDAHFTSFDSGPCHPAEPLNDDGIGCNKTGMTLPYAPDYSGSVFVDIDAPIGENLAFLGGLTVNFSDDYLTNATLDPLGKQKAYARLDARIGIGGADRKWSVSVVGKNLTNEVVNNFTEAFLGVYRGYIREPRTIWLQGSYSFASPGS